MKLSALLAVAAGLILVAEARPQRGAAKKDPLQGEWKLVSTQDEKHIDPGCDESRMIVRPDGGVVFALAGLTMSHGIFTFGTPGKQTSLDLKLADGRTLLAVYEREGDDLVICFAEAGRQRPTGMAPKGSQWAETWQRAGPGGR